MQITLTKTLTLSGYVATRLRDYTAKPDSNSNPNWLRGYVTTQLTPTVTLTLTGYVATRQRGYVTTLLTLTVTLTLSGYAVSFLLLFTISGKCCGRLKYFRPIAGTYFQAVER